MTISPAVRTMAPVFAVLVANAAGLSFVLVVLPPLGRQLGFTDLQTGALLSLSALVLTFSAPVWGYMSEGLGRRLVLLIGIAVTTLALSAMAVTIFLSLDKRLSITAALVLLLVIRLLQAALSGGIMPAAQALVADVTMPVDRAKGMGLLGASYGLGAVAGAALAWRMASHIPLALLLLAALLLCGLLGASIFTRESTRVGHTGHGQSQALQVALIWPCFLITFLGVASYGMIQQVTGLRLQDVLGYSEMASISKAGAILMLSAIAMVLGQSLLVRLPGWTPQRLLLTGGIVATASMAMLAVASTYLVLLSATVVFGASLGLMLPGNLAVLSRRAGGEAQGKAAGINAVGQGLGFAAGPWAGARLYHLSPMAPCLGALLMLALICFLALLLGWKVAVQPRTETSF